MTDRQALPFSLGFVVGVLMGIFGVILAAGWWAVVEIPALLGTPQA